jgi:hypothetical protein
MAAKASELKVAGGSKNLGDFCVDRFNMFDSEDMKEYARLRTDANDASKGIAIEQIREYSRKTTTREGEGPEAVVTSVEEIFLVVHYWKRKPILDKDDSDEDAKETRREWSAERAADPVGGGR